MPADMAVVNRVEEMGVESCMEAPFLHTMNRTCRYRSTLGSED